MIRLLVAEDHRGIREKVIGMLAGEYSVVGAVTDGQEMLDEESKIKPDIVILDISMPNMNGIEAAAALKKRSPNAKVIFLTVHDEPAFLKAAFAAGALGYVIKSRLASDLRPAVREAMAGRRFVSPSIASMPDGYYPSDCH